MNWLDPEEVRALFSAGFETPDAVDWAEIFGAGEPTHSWPSTSEEIARRDLMVARAAAVEFVKALHKKNCLCCMGEGESSRIMVCVDLIARRLEDNDEREGTER